MENIFVEFLPPWIETGLQPAFYDKESGTVLQQTARMYARVNMLIRMFNKLSKNTKTTVEEYINKFNELHDYVHDYFDNLDVQEEINNKLDDMAEDGTLQGLFTGYGLEIGEDNKVKVKAGEGITVNADGVGITPFDDFIQGLEVKTYDYTDENNGANTNIYYMVIPASYKPFVVMADENDPDVVKRPSEFDFKYKPTVMINGGAWNTSSTEAYGPLIIDNVVEVENNLTGGTDTARTIMGIKEDGEVVSINGATSASDVNAKYALRAWYTVIDHGLDKTSGMTTEKEPRTFFAQDVDGNYLVGVCGGRTYDDNGLSKAQIADFLFNHVDGFVPKVAFCLDGGGSSCLMYKGIRQNPLINNENRRCPNYIVFASETANTEGLFEAQSANNAKMIDIARDKSTAWFSKAKLESLIPSSVTEGEITLSAGSIGRIVNGVLVCLNINFTLAETLPQYSYLFENLPKYSSSAVQYFSISLRDNSSDTNNRVCQMYLQNVTDRGCCIRNRFGLPAGAYEMNICYLTQP